MRELRPRRLAGIRVLIRQAVPRENDGTSRLTNDFDLSFLFFLLCIIAEILRKMRVLCQAATDANWRRASIEMAAASFSRASNGGRGIWPTHPSPMWRRH